SASILSLSIQLRTILTPTSGLFWWAPDSTTSGLPLTLPPKSATAICTAASDPLPVASEYRLDMSVKTPSLTTSSEIWACAAPADRTIAVPAAKAAASRFILLLPEWFLLMVGCDTLCHQSQGRGKTDDSLN